MRRTRLHVASAACALSLAITGEARAEHPFIVIRDADGVFAKKTASPLLLGKRTLDGYAATGLPLPEVLSVWTTFPLLGNDVATYIDPRANDVTGINIPASTSSTPPLRAILYHNDVKALAKRAQIQRAPEEGFASYLFLLELMHNWGPEIGVPAPGAQDLIGFDYHWSFFCESTSPAGGNHWKDNADGTFTVVPRAPKDVAYTPLDLYLMGLVDKTEVPPFDVLVSTQVPSTPTDPLWGGAFAAHSFPWFDTASPPLTVTATKRTITIDDVIAANGPRTPAAGTKTQWTLGIVLVVGPNETDQDIAADVALFDPVAADLAPAFARATGQRGSLDVVTHSSDPMGQGGASVGGQGGGASTGSGAPAAPKTSSGGCAFRAGDEPAYDASIFGLGLAIGAAFVRRAARLRAR